MAVISHRHRCIYVKVPKCASTSVLDWFLAHGAGRHTDRPSWYPGPLEHRIVPNAAAVALYPGYFTFTFVRDPHRRFLSVLGHANRLARVAGDPHRYGTVHEFAELCAELLADVRGLWGAEALAFLAAHPARRYGPRRIPLRDLRFLTCHARPQVDFLPDCNPARWFGLTRPDPAPLAFIGAVETLDVDFRRLHETLDLPRLPLPLRNVSAPVAPAHAGALRSGSATRRLVEEIYAADFAFLRRRRDAPAPPSRAPAPRPGLAMRIGRARLALAAFEIALEARIARRPALRRPLAPLARLRRRALAPPSRPG